MLLFLLNVAFAGDPVRCVATLTVPTEGCTLHGNFTITEAGRTEAAASRAARATLAEALDRAGKAFMLVQPNANLKEVIACSALVETAHMDCFPEARLKEKQYCFITLDDADCWSGDVLEIEDTGWKVFSEGTQKMCAAVDAQLVTKNYTDMEVKRATCSASCITKTQVRCP